MPADVALLVSLVAFAALIALPALAAASRRRAMREASDVACALGALAVSVRKSASPPPLDASLRERAQRLGAPEFTWWLLAHDLPQAAPELVADTAQRRRGAVAASCPPLALAALHSCGIQVPLAALLFVVAIEASGCWLLWRMARVEI
jgi:hypothetical protein